MSSSSSSRNDPPATAEVSKSGKARGAKRARSTKPKGAAKKGTGDGGGPNTGASMTPERLRAMSRPEVKAYRDQLLQQLAEVSNRKAAGVSDDALAVPRRREVPFDHTITHGSFFSGMGAHKFAADMLETSSPTPTSTSSRATATSGPRPSCVPTSMRQRTTLIRRSRAKKPLTWTSSRAASLPFQVRWGWKPQDCTTPWPARLKNRTLKSSATCSHAWKATGVRSASCQPA